jgi:hypothetical protein
VDFFFIGMVVSFLAGVLVWKGLKVANYEPIGELIVSLLFFK